MPVETKETTSDQVKIKLTVNGQEMEVTQQEAVELAQKGYDYTKKTQELAKKEQTLKDVEVKVAGLKSIVDEMEADPKLKETLNKVYSDYKSGRVSKSDDTRDRNLRLLDKRIEEATEPETREQLREIREIIKQEAPNTKALEDKVALLEQELIGIREAAQFGLTDRTEAQIEKLKEDYGADLVDRHKDGVRGLALKYPRQSVENLFLHLADKTEVKAALLGQAKKKEKEDLERKKRGSSPSGGDTSFTAKTNLERDKAGRVTHQSILQRVKERLGKA